jgi:hypothetical protein
MHSVPPFDLLSLYTIIICFSTKMDIKEASRGRMLSKRGGYKNIKGEMI